MALTFQEQIKIAQGDVQFTDLKNYVYIAALNYATTFMKTQKVFDTEDANGNPINQAAQSYLNRMQGFAKITLNLTPANRNAWLQTMMYAVAVEISQDTNLTFDQVDGAPADKIQTFLNKRMKGIFEILSGVNRKEKQEYDAL